jgi:hypothetical protein
MNNKQIKTLEKEILGVCEVNPTPHLNITLVGKNTLRTSKLGSDLHADFDRKEITF